VRELLVIDLVAPSTELFVLTDDRLIPAIAGAHGDSRSASLGVTFTLRDASVLHLDWDAGADCG